MKAIKRVFLSALWLICAAAMANDGVYFVSGNQLVPLQETDIEVAKEVLTISLCDDGFARVEVDYVFNNRGPAKSVLMGFEASASYNDDEPFNWGGIHPHIFDFTVTMNGQAVSYRNAVVKSHGEDDAPSFDKMERSQWRELSEDDEFYSDGYSVLINKETNESQEYAYAYYFTANFQQGLNRVRHTYRYRMSYGVGRTFEVPYWLTPAMRWANHQIDDFTLRIKAENTAKDFCISEVMFPASDATIIEGKGKVRTLNTKDFGSLAQVVLRNGTVQWHYTDFTPSEDMEIGSTDAYRSFEADYKLGEFYDRSEHYVPNWQFPDNVSDADRRIMRNLPYASRGYVFKDQKLQQYFSQFFWYMPDPSWQTSTTDFTKREWRLIKEGQ